MSDVSKCIHHGIISFAVKSQIQFVSIQQEFWGPSNMALGMYFAPGLNFEHPCFMAKWSSLCHVTQAVVAVIFLYYFSVLDDIESPLKSLSLSVQTIFPQANNNNVIYTPHLSICGSKGWYQVLVDTQTQIFGIGG